MQERSGDSHPLLNQEWLSRVSNLKILLFLYQANNHQSPLYP